ncbi:GrpB family protein [Paenibacillus albiflavus]|uniref:GrpB family protein n=1 Tax=Paenibacillus albiflavus TaxID=2545760 RepID=A0A4R4DX19_9BACL|nr:GrpB family protein [Paenibacillus albiflavus]TCZ69015.1 GrpB family protein [Paenibacillus albiflavus]
MRQVTLKKIFGSLAREIQHFGSTSVPGMIAKPIINILIGVLNMDLDKTIIKDLIQAGYEGFGEAGVPGRLYFRKRKEVQAFNLAIVEWNGEQWNNNILIRQFLRQNPENAREYSERKFEAVSKGLTTLLSYSDEKAEYVYNLLQMENIL